MIKGTSMQCRYGKYIEHMSCDRLDADNKHVIYVRRKDIAFINMKIKIYYLIANETAIYQ